jgi:hypothetical protein
MQERDTGFLDASARAAFQASLPSGSDDDLF